jgi:hypothetical protein
MRYGKQRKMNWQNLLDERCPKPNCGAPLDGDPKADPVKCGMKVIGECDFEISRERFEVLKYELGLKSKNGKRQFEEGYGD